MSQQTDDVRAFRDVQHTDAVVREYRPVTGQRLYAYREDDTHVVVCRGSDPDEQWVREIPATLERPIDGQHRWTIPDNWELFAKSTRDTIAHGIYYIPETELYVEVTIPTNDHCNDAWYSVQSVGELTVAPTSELGDFQGVRKVWSDYVDKYDEDDVADVLDALADGWIHIEMALGYAIDDVRTERLPDPSDKDHIHTDEHWVVEFPTHFVDYVEAIEHDYNLPGDSDTISIAFDELRDAGVLPRYDAVEIGVEEIDKDVEYTIRGIVESGGSASMGLDYAMVTVAGFTQTEWAAERGVDQSTVSENVSKATTLLERGEI